MNIQKIKTQNKISEFLWKFQRPNMHVLVVPEGEERET